MTYKDLGDLALIPSLGPTRPPPLLTVLAAGTVRHLLICPAPQRVLRSGAPTLFILYPGPWHKIRQVLTPGKCLVNGICTWRLQNS